MHHGPSTLNTHQKIVVMQKPTPFIINQNTIRLQRILNYHSWANSLLYYFHSATKEVNTHQGWFATLPSNSHCRRRVRLDGLANVFFHNFLGHVEVTIWIQLFLL
jgi:hypothetical protein